MTTLSVQQLQVPYSKKELLPVFSFEITAPVLVFITGPNGIGKSSFLKQIIGKLTSKNAVLINNKLLHDYSLQERASLIGFLEQHHSIHFPLLVKDLVVMGRFVYKAPLESYTSKDYEMVAHVLKELNIEYLYHKNFLQLSGGEQQLCLLAQLALQDPAIIILDEPTQSLDLHNKERVFNWMRKQVNEKGKIVLCVTHDLHWITKESGFLLALNHSAIELEPLDETLVLRTIEKLRKQF
ncbi:MAG TPA: ABC transporter ATP-binding protein [Cytophagaceae bacterium]|nr:ABC transporter ATP-binding protein [Cytophagaceae bacterium]